MKKFRYFFLWSLLLLPLLATARQTGDLSVPSPWWPPYIYPVTEVQVFDNRDFFFRSSPLQPGSMGMFDAAGVSLFTHPLQLVAENPARLANAFEGSVYSYIDARTLPSESIEPAVPYYPCVNCLSVVIPEVQRSLFEPMVSLASFYRPGENRNVTFGVTWKHFRQKDDFFTQVGTYGGSAGIWFDDDLIPFAQTVFDESRVSQTAYLPAFVASWQITPDLAAGLRVGYAWYQLEGNQQSGSYYGYGSSPATYGSTAAQDRESSYSHLDFSLGLDVRLSDRLGAGITAGYLNAGHESIRNGHRVTNQLSANPGFQEPSTNSSLQNRIQVDTRQQQGYAVYAAADMRYKFGSDRMVRFYYRVNRSSRDLESDDTQGNSNMSISRVMDDGEEVFTYQNLWRIMTNDGNGSRRDWAHTASTRMDIRQQRSIELSVGLQADLNFQRLEGANQANTREYSRTYRERNGEEEIDEELVDEFFQTNVVEIDLRASHLFAPLSMRWNISSFISMEGVVMPGYQYYRRETTRYYPNTSGSNNEPVSYSDSRIQVNYLASVWYRPQESVTVSLSAMPEYGKNIGPEVVRDRGFVQFMLSAEVKI